ncbi:MAG TPA: hypothetical protein VM686_40185, partial [Polyangiaceae bacterium]|nr:hypothetical protein [Polyangiaceae bacterium]
LKGSASGLLGSVKAATQAADQALLLSDRAMFLATRMPFLVRLQARLGAQEIVADSLDRATELQGALAKVPETATPVIHDLTALSSQSLAAVRETHAAIDAFKPLLGEPGALRETIDSTRKLAETSLELAREVHAIEPQDVQALATTVEVRVERLARRVVTYLGLLGAACSVVFWGGYIVAKRLTPEIRRLRFQ